uniref:Uncharacterized protein n=1 Tax=Gorilla gorilla gorilla TaxID=9595 RepID=G3S031_GORGO
MQKHYTVAWFLYSAPGVDPSPPCRSLGWKRKRERSDESEEEPEKELASEPEETWVVETLCGLKMKLKQQRVSPILPEHHKDFNSQLAPGVDPSPPCRSLGWKRKRERSDESEEEPEKELAPEPEETWVVEMLCGLKMKLKQQRVSPILPEHHKDFNSQLYLLAMVIAYFSRAGFPSWLYQRIHFFLA